MVAEVEETESEVGGGGEGGGKDGLCICGEDTGVKVSVGGGRMVGVCVGGGRMVGVGYRCVGGDRVQILLN